MRSTRRAFAPSLTSSAKPAAERSQRLSDTDFLALTGAPPVGVNVAPSVPLSLRLCFNTFLPLLVSLRTTVFLPAAGKEARPLADHDCLLLRGRAARGEV